MSLVNRSNRTSASFPGLWASKLTLAFFSLLILLQIGNLQAQTCTVTDYLYLNDVTKDNNGNGIGYVHKLRLNPGISATEIYSSGTKSWFPAGGVLKTPHGLGQDLNGNLYIGQTGDGPIAKIKCNGTVVNANFINDGGFNVVSKDGYLYIDDNGSNRINRYSLCDGSAQGYIVLNGDFSYGSETMKDWGLEIDPDGTFYVTAGFNVLNNNKNTYIYRFKPTDASFTAHTAYTAQLITGVGVSLKPGTGDSGISNTNEVWGITHDPAGNMYIVVQDRTDDTNKETWILKYNKNFTLVDYIMEKDDTPTGGIEGARGIVYYAPWDRLLIAGGPDGDCVAKVRPSDMVYTGALAPNEPGQTPKTLRIASEACPTAAALTVDTTMCNVQVGDKVFLQNIIGTCNAPICGGTWTASTGNAGITFNECDLSFTVTNVAIGCGKFTLKNVGGTCGDFTITVNVDFANVTAPVLGGNQTVCAGSDIPTPFTTVTPATGSNTIKYQWQKSTASCTAGFTNIANATASTYTPTVLTQTKYYRVVTTVDGNCSTPRGSCADTSNCVTVTTKVCCAKPVVTVTPGTCNPATNQYSISGTISLTNASAGTATITDGTRSTTVAIAATATSVAYSLAGFTSGTGSHTVTVSLPGCGSDDAVYTAPASCTVAPCALNVVVTPGSCNSATNQYSISGTVSFTNAVAGTLSITDGVKSTTVAVAAGATSVAYSLTGLTSGSGSHTVVASLTGCGTDFITYAAPASCTVCTVNLVTSTLPNGQVGTAYSRTLVTSGGTTPYTYAVSTGTLPAGLSLNPTSGVISGTPTSATTASFTIKVTDAKSCSDVAALSITTSSAPVCLLTVTATPGTCNANNNNYRVTGTISATNTTGNQSLTISVGSVTTTASLTGNGPVSYTLIGLLSDGLTKTVSVISSATACGSASVTYSAPASCTVCSLSLVTSNLPNGQVGTPYAHTIITTGGNSPLSFSVAGGTLPEGLSLNPTTGVIAGVPTAAGSFTVTFTITDSKGCRVSLPLTVFDINTGPVCSIGLAVTPGVCSSATNTYTLSGMVSLSNNTTGGTILITSGLMTTTLTISNTATLVPFSLTGLGSDGLVHTVTATLTGCGTGSTTYSAPQSCTIACQPPIHVCKGTDYAFQIDAPTGQASYQWYRNGVVIASATLSSFTATQAGSYSVVINGTAVGQCPDGSCCPVVIVEDSIATYQAQAQAPTCSTASSSEANADGRIVVTNWRLSATDTTTYFYQVSLGSRFNEAQVIGGSTLRPVPASGVVVADLANPATAGGQAYTVRICNGLGCEKDVVVILPQTICSCPPAKCVLFVIKKVHKAL
ncbi:putative Ig domain-containing protein [Spirosoma pollinicola]|nr:putative Ig domain-containing protein [Spirosoma pollinicola]